MRKCSKNMKQLKAKIKIDISSIDMMNLNDFKSN